VPVGYNGARKAIRRMISQPDLVTTANSYLRAARLLNRKDSSSPDASVYLCGYAVEIALKARICITLNWPGYPSEKKEFEGYTSFQTHNLGRLLRLSGVETRIISDPILLIEWSIVLKWNPEQRYNPVGTKTAIDAEDMIEATKKILRVLL
jgi:hypothetical protein